MREQLLQCVFVYILCPALFKQNYHTQKILEALYDYNHLPENYDVQEYTPGSREEKPNMHQWGGPVLRRAAQAIYTIAYLCLLRVDEVLRIQVEHVEFIRNGENFQLVLTLPFRKTHQFGGERY